MICHVLSFSVLLIILLNLPLFSNSFLTPNQLNTFSKISMRIITVPAINYCCFIFVYTLMKKCRLKNYFFFDLGCEIFFLCCSAPLLDRFFNINRAQQSDPNDHLVEYYLGLGCACRALVAEAVAHTRAALKLCPEHAPSLHLMVLLLSAQKQLTEANALLNSALQDFPDNLGLLYVKTHLQLQTHGPEVMELMIVL